MFDSVFFAYVTRSSPIAYESYVFAPTPVEPYIQETSIISASFTSSGTEASHALYSISKVSKRQSTMYELI